MRSLFHQALSPSIIMRKTPRKKGIVRIVIKSNLDEEISFQIYKVEEIIKKHVEESTGILKLGFSPRLLETILLSSYYHLYLPDRRFPREVLEIVRKETLDPSIFPSLDMNIQDLLYTLHHDSSKDNIDQWFLLYNSLLQSLFRNDNFENQRRKLLAFNIIALFSTTNQVVQQAMLDRLLNLVAYLDPDSIFSTKTTIKTKNPRKHPPWHLLYYIVFFLLWSYLKSEMLGKDLKLIDQKYETKLRDFLGYLEELQDPDGAWQKNNLLTLLLLHVLRFCQMHERFPNQVTPLMTKAEKYLESNYLMSGLSVLPSQELYNTALFFGSRFYFTGLLPPKTTVNTLLSAQHEDGGIKFHQHIKFSDFDTTGFSILTFLPAWLETEDLMLEKALKKCVDYMWNIRKDDGSFPLYAHASETLPEMTARALMVSAILPPTFIEEQIREQIITDGLDNLLILQNDDGSFNYNAYSASMLYPISQVALALHFLNISPFVDATQHAPISNEIKYRILSYLKRCQNPDGSYNVIPFKMSYGEQQSTSYAILSWASLQPRTPHHIKALNWLLLFTKNGIRSFPEGTGPRPIRYNDLSHGPIFVYLAHTSTRHSDSPLGMAYLKDKLSIP